MGRYKMEPFTENGLRRARKASLYFTGEESKYFIWTFVNQRKKTILSTKKHKGNTDGRASHGHLTSAPGEDTSEVGKICSFKYSRGRQ